MSGEKYNLERGNSRHSGFQVAARPGSESSFLHKTSCSTVSDQGVEEHRAACDVCARSTRQHDMRNEEKAAGHNDAPVHDAPSSVNSMFHLLVRVPVIASPILQ